MKWKKYPEETPQVGMGYLVTWEEDVEDDIPDTGPSCQVTIVKTKLSAYSSKGWVCGNKVEYWLEFPRTPLSDKD